MGINDASEYEHFKHVPALQSWIRTQSHLPQNIGKFITSSFHQPFIWTKIQILKTQQKKENIQHFRHLFGQFRLLLNIFHLFFSSVEFFNIARVRKQIPINCVPKLYKQTSRK